ncbi:MAG: sacsin N-terminal ATP-binding-like domain-containing protein [Candidatus Pristimantibacillus sp.]
MIIQTENRLNAIASKTMGELQVFLNQILNDNQTYKSLSNVVEHMKHEYANRFVIELLQNGYDAISNGRLDDPSSIGKIKMVLLEDKDRPVFYFANTGRPITENNFKSLSSLALSDKKPSESVGNKGVGFKSVLQVCMSPQIYSGKWEGEEGFSGFCFEFAPKKIDLLAEKIIEMVESKLIPDFGDIFGIPVTMKHWPHHQIAELEQIVQQRLHLNRENHIGNFFHKEMKYLSPYSLPFPISPNTTDPMLKKLGEEGYVTIIRLELNQPDALELTKKAMFELDEQSWLFLDHISELHIEHRDEDGLFLQERRMYKKETILIDHGSKLSEVVISSEEQEPAVYWRWTKTIGGIGDPQMREKIHQAVSELHQSWADLDEARIETAVRKGGRRDTGLIYIYLPTRQLSGVAAHINAPFFGQINRGGIDHRKRWNSLLLSELANLQLEAVRQVLDLQPRESGDMVIDLLSFHPNQGESEPGSILASHVDRILKEDQIELAHWPIIPFRNEDDQQEFGAMVDLICLQKMWSYRLFSRENLSGMLGIGIVSDVSDDRYTALNMLAKHAKVNMYPDDNRKVEWIEACARLMQSQGCPIDVWQLFYDEVMLLIPDPERLQRRYVLLGQDGKLHLAGDEEQLSEVFLSPSQSADVDEEEAMPHDPDKIPSFMQHKISYLNEDLDKHREKGGKRTSDLLKYLRKGNLVGEFRVQTFLDKIILPEMPTGRIPYGTSKSNQLFELLEWAMHLYYGSRATESYQNRFLRLWLPSRSGWIPAIQSYFSADWDRTGVTNHAGRLSQFFEATAHQDGLNRQLVNIFDLPPSFQQFGESRVARFFQICGAVDYLKLVPAVPGGTIAFRGWGYRYRFNTTSEGYFNIGQMLAFKKAVESARCNYDGDFEYELREVMNIDGIKGYEHFPDDVKRLFACLVVYSAAYWEKDEWRWTRIHKIRGEKPYITVASLVSVTLQQLAWVPIPADKADDITFRRLVDTWYVPAAELAASRANFSFIPYMDRLFVFELEQSERWELFGKLGLNKFKASSVKEAVKLLDLLATLHFEGKVSPSQINYLKGHYRTAWDILLQQLVNTQRLADFNAPSKILYTKARRVHVAALNETSERIYIPNDKKLVVRLERNPIVSVLLIDGRPGYTELLKSMYGETLPLLSELTQLIQIDGSEWNGGLSLEPAEMFVEGERQWLLPFLLTVATFREDSNIYVSSAAYNRLLSELQGTRVVFCESIEISLEDKNSGSLERTHQLIYASKEHKTIFIQKEAGGNGEELATALAEYLEIVPMEMYLKHAFSKLDFDLRRVVPDRSALTRALQSVKISEDNFEAIEHSLNHNLGWAIERLAPVIKLYEAEEMLQDEHITEELDLMKLLESVLPYSMDPAYLLKLARESANDFQMGQHLFDEYGLSLSTWNKALEGMAMPRKIIENDEIIQEFNSLKGMYRETVYGILRNEVRSGQQNIEEYVACKTQYENWKIRDSWSTTYWQLPEEVFVLSLIEVLQEMRVDSSLLVSIRGISCLSDIKDALSQTIPDIKVPTYEMRQANQILTRNTVRTMLSAFLSHYQAKDLVTPNVLHITETTLFQKIMGEGLVELMELAHWEDKDVYTFILTSQVIGQLRYILPEGLTSVRSKDELLSLLQVRESDLELAEKKLEQEKEKAQRAKRTVAIFGQSFDTDDSNFHQLANLVDSITLPEDTTYGDILAPMELEKTGPGRGNGGSGGGGQTKGAIVRENKQIETAVGIIGELLAFRYLLKRFPNACSKDSWKSENRMYRFGGEAGNDRLGYDFEITQNRKTYHIEVKATRGRDPYFELGSTEQRMAIEDAGKRTKEFVVLFITNVFDKPEFHWLSNPYASANKERYRIYEAGARVFFRWPEKGKEQ